MNFEATNKLAILLSSFLEKIEEKYRSLLTKLIQNSVSVVIGALVLFAATLPIFYQLGGEFFQELTKMPSH